MWETVFETVSTGGVWAVLFSVLLWYLLQDSRKRENKYQKTIEMLTERLEIVVDIKEKLDEITVRKVRSSKIKKIENDEEEAA